MREEGWPGETIIDLGSETGSSMVFEKFHQIVAADV
jgi:hypothetical protein